MKKKIKRGIASLLLATMTVGTVESVTALHTERILTVQAEEDHWFSQKGWTYNGSTLTSLCYITSYAMILRSLGYDVTPVDVYVANGKSNFCNHTLIGNAYGVDAVSETGSLSGKTEEEKKEFVKGLIAANPQGVIVGGNYGLSTHYIVAKKVVGDEIYFDDPAYVTSEEGCCIDISKVYKLNWSYITTYRVVKKKSEDTSMNVVQTSEPEAVATATPIPATPEPTEKVVLTATPKAATGEAISDDEEETQEETEEVEVYNPLGKYEVPTRTIYYKTPPMKGADVKWIEAVLKKLGCVIAVNGKFTKVDQKAIMAYQRKKGLAVDGYVGKMTRKKMISDLEIANTKVQKVSGLKISKSDVSVMSVSDRTRCQITALWSKVADVTGYEVLCSTRKNFKNTRKWYKKKNNAVISQLIPGTTYFVKVRAYKTVNGTNVYGSYSSVKKITISE